MNSRINNIPSLTTSNNDSLELVARGFITVMSGQTLGAGVWKNAKNDTHHLTVGHDTVIFDISDDLARDLCHNLKSTFFSANLEEMRVDATDRMKWLSEVNWLMAHRSQPAFVGYVVGDDHLSVEMNFEGSLPTGFRPVSITHDTDLFGLPAPRAASMLAASINPDTND